MGRLCVIAAGVALLSLTTIPGADGAGKGDTATKLVGKWEVTKATDATLVGAVVTFEKGGKVSLVKKDGKGAKLDGTYKVEKDKLVSDVGGNADTNTIKKLTADALELEHDDSGATTVL